MNPITNIARRFESSGTDARLIITWDDEAGPQHITLHGAHAISAAAVLWNRRTEPDRIAYLKQIIVEETAAVAA